MSFLQENKNDYKFVPSNQCVGFCKNNLGLHIEACNIELLINSKILPTFSNDNETLVLVDDLKSLAHAITAMSEENQIRFLNGLLFEKEVITPCVNTRIDLVLDKDETTPVFHAAIKNLLSASPSFDSDNSIDITTIQYFSSTRVSTTSNIALQFINNQMERARKADMTRLSQFTRSAHYMGSKRNLSTFLVEAISSVLRGESVVVDLMCGSGVASGSFSKFWNVISSDSQEFCRILSVIHGGGFSSQHAMSLISQLISHAKKHAMHLKKKLPTFIEVENIIFHSDIGQEVLEKYQDFTDRFPTYSNKKSVPRWDPIDEVNERKSDSKLYPYCLFTSYFANIYFGVRQCIEIDSLRFAIDQLHSEIDRQWSLGALICTISDLGTTFGGHFAQPPIRTGRDLNLDNISDVIDKRSYSLMHEFSVRLLNLSEESQSSPRQVNSVPGPWREALITLEPILKDKDVLVYLDAPYKREDYSRFYHVLETLVRYSYHSCIGISRTPDIRKGERFKSEFSTTNKQKVTQTFVTIIKEIISRGWICAWSYSNTGDANIVSVINQINQEKNCIVRSYSTPYIHKSHGGNKPKNVIEYLILFIPAKTKSSLL